MSEFTSGNLILKKNRGLIEKNINCESIIQDINESWIVLLTEDDYTDMEVPLYIIELSKCCPILYFFNYEDHGWGYRIFSEGKETASLFIYYELEFYKIIDIAEKRYPSEEDITSFLCFTEAGKKAYDKIQRELVLSDSFIRVVADQFKNSNVKEFGNFEISGEIIKRLGNLITSQHFINNLYRFKMVEEFKRLLGIEEMSWISFNYSEGSKDRWRKHE